jgi:hypothetical protein
MSTDASGAGESGNQKAPILSDAPNALALTGPGLNKKEFDVLICFALFLAFVAGLWLGRFALAAGC